MEQFEDVGSVRQLSQRVNATKDDVQAWRAREKTWGKDVLHVMRVHGCTEQDIHKVEMIGVFPLSNLHPIQKVARDLSMLSVRLERIQEIIDKYAE